MSYTVHCPQHLNITMVEGFKGALQAAIDEGGECHLNVSLVEKVDSTGVQLLLVFQEAMKAKDGVVKLKGESEPLFTTLDVLGLSQKFEKH